MSEELTWRGVLSSALTDGESEFCSQSWREVEAWIYENELEHPDDWVLDALGLFADAWNRRAGEGAECEVCGARTVEASGWHSTRVGYVAADLTAQRDALAARVEGLEQRAEWADPLAGMMSELADRFAPDAMKGETTFTRALWAVDQAKRLAARVEELEGVLKRIAAITPKPEHGPEYVAGQIGGITTAADQAIGKP